MRTTLLVALAAAVAMLQVNGKTLSEDELRSKLRAAGFALSGVSTSIDAVESSHTSVLRLRHLAKPSETSPPPVIAALAGDPGLIRLEWQDVA
jgi:hypothetical protein